MFPEQRTGGFRLEWLGQEKSLHEFAADLAQLPYVLLRLHAFGNGFQPQLLSPAS